MQYMNLRAVPALEISYRSDDCRVHGVFTCSTRYYRMLPELLQTQPDVCRSPAQLRAK